MIEAQFALQEHHAWAMREQQQADAVLNHAQAMHAEAQHQEISWRPAEELARTVLYARDAEIQEAMTAQIGPAQMAIADEHRQYAQYRWQSERHVEELEALVENKTEIAETYALQNAALVAAASDQGVDQLREELQRAQLHMAEEFQRSLEIQGHAREQTSVQQAQLKEATENLAWMQDELQVYLQNRDVEALRRRQYEG